MFQKDIDKKMADLFLRSAGLFFVALWLRDLVSDPLIQYENISYWLRVIQTHLSSFDEEKRVVIVGMVDANDKQNFPNIRKYVDQLNLVLHERELHKNLFNSNCGKKSPTERSQHEYVTLFDVSQSDESSQELISQIDECMDLFIMKMFHYNEKFYTSVFKAFTGLNATLQELSFLPGITASLKDLQAICSQKPDYVFETLASYSTSIVRVSTKGKLHRFV